MNRIREFAVELAERRAVAAHLETLRRELRLVARARPTAEIARSWKCYGWERPSYMPLTLEPILDTSPGAAGIAAGIAVGWHMPPPGLTVPNALTRHDGRFLMGDLIHRSKMYTRGTPLHIERSEDLANLAACALAETKFIDRVDLLVSAPSSRGANTLPRRVAERLSGTSDIGLAPLGSLRFTRATGQSKEMHDYESKRERLSGTMGADRAMIEGRRVLIVDDLCTFGVTLSEAARACRQAGAAEVFVLALSKTFRHQRHPDEQPTLRPGTAVAPPSIRRPSPMSPPPAPPQTWFVDPNGGFPEDMTEVPIP